MPICISTQFFLFGPNLMDIYFQILIKVKNVQIGLKHAGSSDILPNRYLICSNYRSVLVIRDENPDPVIFGLPDPVLFSIDPDPDTTCNKIYISIMNKIWTKFNKFKLRQLSDETFSLNKIDKNYYNIWWFNFNSYLHNFLFCDYLFSIEHRQKVIFKCIILI